MNGDAPGNYGPMNAGNYGSMNGDALGSYDRWTATRGPMNGDTPGNYGPMNDLAERLEVTPATVSLMVGERRKGILERRQDPDDRRRAIIRIDRIARRSTPGSPGVPGPGARRWNR